MNNFPDMTEEKRQELIELCEAVLAGHVQYGGDSNEEDIYKIALAALTAEPVGWMVQYGGIDKEMFVDKQAAARLHHDVTENGF